MPSGVSAKVSRSSASIPVWAKLYELSFLFRMRLRGVFNQDTSSVFADIAEYEELLIRYAGKALRDAKVFEIGFGARPYRLVTIMSLGIDAFGADLDVPVLSGSPREFLKMYKQNGLERVLKSLVRFTLFDLIERRALAAAIARRGYRMIVDENRFLIRDATEVEIPDHSLDLIVSEDVFEHIPTSSLKLLVPRMAKWLKRNGIALIRPNIFTGITGGHLAEWFPQTLKNKNKNIARRSEPWEHLRKRRYVPNTYLNQLSRAEYRILFHSEFRILEERVKDADLGKEFWTSDVQRELADYPAEELFSNRVLFVLRPN